MYSVTEVPTVCPDCGHQGKAKRYIQSIEDLAARNEIPTEGVVCSNPECLRYRANAWPDSAEPQPRRIDHSAEIAQRDRHARSVHDMGAVPVPDLFSDDPNRHAHRGGKDPQGLQESRGLQEGRGAHRRDGRTVDV